MPTVFKPRQLLEEVILNLGGCEVLAEHISHSYDLASFCGADEDNTRRMMAEDFNRNLDFWVTQYLETDDLELHEFPNPYWRKAAIKSGKIAE